MEPVKGDDHNSIMNMIISLLKQIKNAIQLDERRLLTAQEERMTKLAHEISDLFQKQQPLEKLNDCLKIMEDEVKLLRILTCCRLEWPYPCFYCLQQLVGSVDRYIITSRVISLTKHIDNIIQLDDRRFLEPQFQEMKSLALKISDWFQHQHWSSLNNDLVYIENEVRWARLLIQLEDKVRWARILIQRSGWLLQCLPYKPKPSGEISEWNTDVNNLFKELKELQTDLLVELQRVGTGIKRGEVVVERWLREDPHVRMIGVCGDAGVGKTTLLQNVYNTYKVSDLFDVVIWVTVAQFGISEVRDCIARALNLDLGAPDSISQTRQVKLSEYLKTKEFLLIFDNMWNPLDLKKLGVEFGEDKGSKFICSSRKSAVTEVMMAKRILYVQPMTREEAWELFHNIAFKDLHLPEGLKHIARQVADQCKGSPIALKVVAATMKGDTSVDEWNLALWQMRLRIDHKFPSFELEFDEDLYRILRWSYERLPDANFKSCFMYCVMFPRDEEIEVDKLVGMWIAEDLVESMDLTNLIDAAHGYLKLLVDRCFFQVTRIPHGRVFLKTHNTLLDVAIYIGRRERHCLTLQDFNNFPVDSKGNDG